MSPFAIRLAALSALLVLAATPALAQDTPPADGSAPAAKDPPAPKPAAGTPVPGTHVALVPPEGFKKAGRFSGFADEERGASILVAELPGPFAEVSAGLRDDAQMAKRGMKATARAEVAIGDKTALLVSVTQSQQGVAYEKRILVAPKPAGTVVITATFRADDAAALAAPLEAVLRGAEIAKSKHGEALAFEVGASKRLVLAYSQGGMGVWCEPGKLGKGTPADPVLVVTRSHSPTDIGDRAEFAKQRLAKTAYLSAFRDVASKETRVDGLTGVETTAIAKHAKDGAEAFVFQVVLFEENGGYWILQGLVANAQRAAWEEEFRTMAAGFRRTQKGD